MRVFDVNGNIKADALSSTISVGTAAGGDLTGTYPNPTAISSGLLVKVANSSPDGVVVRNGADTAWQCASGVQLGGTAAATVSGSRGGNAALASLLTGLQTMGIILDSSS